MIDLVKIQNEHYTWELKNFGVIPPHHGVLGAVEEWGEFNEEIMKANIALGKLSHAQLKSEQGIRINEDHEKAAKDAIGDMQIFFMSYCNKKGWNLEKIIEDTWEHVKARDWKANPETGDQDVDKL